MVGETIIYTAWSQLPKILCKPGIINLYVKMYFCCKDKTMEN